MKVLSNTERNRRKLKKMYISFENKLSGDDLLWWNSLSLKARYHLLFSWRNTKKSKLKHFLNDNRKKYRVQLQNHRESVLNHLLK
jgi:hypothetical protein